jgi:hypothetical protein
MNKAPTIVQCAHLTASDFDDSPDNTVIVKTGKASNFRVVRQARGIFIVYGRTEFVGGSTIVRGISGVHSLLMTR